MLSRRRWLSTIATIGGTSVATHVLGAQEQERASGLVDSSNLFAMDQGAARSVRLSPKPGARPSMTPDQRDALEHRIRCQCGCTLSVYTCRTTDFSCQVSPAMHRDILALVDGGYEADEITAAFVDVYGERALMAPTRDGFNLVGWILPGTTIAVGGIVLATLIRRWRRTAPAVTTTTPATAPLDASADELRRLEAAIRDDA